MMLELIQLIVLFFVIFDPLASFAVFYVATKNVKVAEKRIIALYAILIASLLSFSVLFFGEQLLSLFTTNLNDFRVAGGLILGILGIKMTLGHPLTNLDNFKNNTSKGIAAIIGTPLLTGPAAITAIIIAVHDYGRMLTGLAVLIVLVATGFLLLLSSRFDKLGGKTAIQVISTMLGLITIAWGVKFIRMGLGI